MPIYEFICECGNKVEMKLPLDHEDQICDICGEVLEKIVSGNSLLLGCPTIRS